MPVDVPLELLFLPAGTDTSAADTDEAEIGEEDLGVSFYRDDEIDLGEVMREQFYLAVPMKPLCREDCRGLCPVCGINRNRETCSCQTDWVDPRLEPLRKLVDPSRSRVSCRIRNDAIRRREPPSAARTTR